MTFRIVCCCTDFCLPLPINQLVGGNGGSSSSSFVSIRWTLLQDRYKMQTKTITDTYVKTSQSPFTTCRFTNAEPRLVSTTSSNKRREAQKLSFSIFTFNFGSAETVEFTACRHSKAEYHMTSSFTVLSLKFKFEVRADAREQNSRRVYCTSLCCLNCLRKAFLHTFFPFFP